MQSETGFPSSHQLKSYVAYKFRLKLAARAVLSAFLFVTVSVVAALKLVVMSAVRATIATSLSSMIKNVGWVSRSCRTYTRDNNIHKSKTGSQLDFDQLSTGLRHAYAGLRPGRRPGLRLYSVMEFDLYRGDARRSKGQIPPGPVPRNFLVTSP